MVVSFSNLANNIGRNLDRGTPGRIYGAKLAVSRVAFVQQLFDARSRVIVLSEERSIRAGDAFSDVFWLRDQTINMCPGRKVGGVFAIEHHAAAGCNHRTRSVGEFCRDRRFQLPEFVLSAIFEDLADGAVTGLDELVRIDKVVVEEGCEQTPDGGFSGTHESGQDHLFAVWLHGVRVYDRR